MLIQKLLIRYILEPLAGLTHRFSQRLRDMGFVLAGLAIFGIFFARETRLLDSGYVVVYALSCLCLGLMILFSLKKGLKPVKFRPAPAICWFAVGGLMLLSGLTQNTDYIAEAALLLVAYPVCYIVWQNTGPGKLFHSICRIVRWSFVLYVVICLVFYPMENVRYRGLFENLNGAAAYLSLVCVCSLVDCLGQRKFTAALAARMLLLATALSLLFYTSSRTGILSFFVAAAVYLVWYALSNRKELGLYFFRNLATAALSFVLLFNTAIYVFQLPVLIESMEQVSQGPSSSQTGQKPQQKPQVDLIDPGESLDKINDRFDTEGLDANEISSGRLHIWEGYLQKLNLMGHPDSGTVVPEGSKKEFHSAHMTVLQIAYENGAVAGVLYLAFNLIAGIYAICYALRNAKSPYGALPLMITVTYAVYSLLASTVTSFLYITTFVYYLVQFPILTEHTAGE